MNKEIVEYLAQEVDNITKIVEHLKLFEETTREQDIAIQKLEEAVFWLTYGIYEDESCTCDE